jgi:TetR/AcrR family transcriptional repressor of nem operon
MPRVSRERAEHNRRAITEASARLFRERGINGVSVADLMAAAGLTHGGFYGHFESKDALAAEACDEAFEQSVERWKKLIAGAADGPAARSALVDGYLTPQARAQRGTGCPTAGLAGDIAREADDAPIRAVYLAGVESLLAILESVQQEGDTAAGRRAALADFATLVGTLTLARATAGSPLSDEFLEAGRARLNEPRARRADSHRRR